MNKKILSCALVAAMLASSVGAMGVSAAKSNIDDDAYAGKNYPKYDADVSDATFGHISEERPIVFDDVVDVTEFDKDYFYFFNFEKKGTTDVTVDQIEEAQDDGNYKLVKQTLYAYLKGWNLQTVKDNWEKGDAHQTKEPIPYEASTDVLDMSDTRATAVSDFKDVVEKAKKFATDTEPLYDEEYLVSYKVVDADPDEDRNNTEDRGYLIHDIIEVSERGYAKLPTSLMIYYVNEYDRLLGDDGMIGQTGTWEEKYNALSDIVSILTSDDYSSRNWIKVEKQIALAEDNAAKGTTAGYKAAYEDLMYIFENIVAETPDYDSLKDALDSLFTKKMSSFDVTNYKGTKGADCVYLKEDYEDRDGYLPDAWYDFAGTKDENDVYGAYRLAARIYNNCKTASTRKYMPQSLVNYAVENLTTSIQNLDPNKETANWIIVMLEDALDIANSVVESDYRTNTSYWKNFQKDVAAIEDLLEATVVQESAAESAIKDLFGKDMDATKGTTGTYAELSKCKLSVPSATRNELRDKINEAKDLLKDKTGKTSTQISELQTALADAEDITTANTISQYETAIADLDAAMTNYNHPQGWYQANGAWYYGREDANVTGWLNVSGTWYYLDPANDGRMMTGWQQIGGTWYYLKDTGAMATGWLNQNGTYYYLESWGGMATGWKSVNGSWYYLDPAQGGKMLANGWYWISGKCYYFYNWGGMAANTTIDGYTVDASGAWVR